MIIFPFKFALAAALVSGAQDWKQVPASVAPRNEVERLVLSSVDGAGERIGAWIEAHASDRVALDAELSAGGFKRLPDRNGCGNYAYSRSIGEKGLERFASVIWCKKPFVLVGTGYPSMAVAPLDGADALSTPLPPKPK